MNSTGASFRKKMLLLLILLLGSGLRLYGVNWDDSHHLHPDERFMVLTVLNISWPDSFAGYFNIETSPLSPYNNEHHRSYIYGTFPLFLTKGVATLCKMHTYGTAHLVGRTLSALFDLGSLLLVYLIATRLFSVRAGILSSALYAVTVMHIQQSHFFTVDTFLVFWIAVTFLLLVIFLEKNQHRALLLSSLIGAGFGCALACKASAFLFMVIILSALVIKAALTYRRGAWYQTALSLAGNTLVFVLFSYCTYRLIQPYAFASSNWFDLTPQPYFWNVLEAQRQAIAGKAMFPSQWQWVNTAPVFFPLKNILLWGLGLPLGCAALLGMGLFLASSIQMLARRKRVPRMEAVSAPALLALIWIVIAFAYGGTPFVKSMRYLLPAAPFLLLFAAYACEAFLTRFHGLSRAVSIIVFGLTALWALAYVTIYARDTTRVAASQWIYRNVPEGSVLANEAWDDPLPLRLADDFFKQEQMEYRPFESFLMHVYNPDSGEKVKNLCDDLGRADYLILSSPRARATVGRLPVYFPVMTRYYNMLESGGLGFDEVYAGTSYPRLFGREINDSAAEESFWVYDHPPVRIYRKARALSGDACEDLLSHGTLDIKGR
jgi:4-amino-4-deoxy-L-arabinose transferase-like glycosyltransferase